LGLFALSAFCSLLIVVSRAIDFRLTARKLKNDIDREEQKVPRLVETVWKLGKEAYSELTWFFVWVSLACFFCASVIYSISIGCLLVDIPLSK
jgi:hypothetical protein